ncbi:MAG: hypothetical protein KA998_02260 [Rickettsiaceae bacterium]|nr:hypothetical protein [Rickettsiaceae bacterium]
MREVKSFFIENNSLNKGYVRDNKSDDSVDNVYHKKLHKNMPPVDVIAAYEALYPGTIDKIVDERLKQRGQEVLSKNITGAITIKARAITGFFNFLSVAVICYVFLSLVKNDMWLVGLVFTAIAFGGFFMFLSSGKKDRPAKYSSHPKSSLTERSENRNYSNNNKRRQRSRMYKNNKNG